MDTRLHWNYFLALEKDLERVSRYIEFCTPNLQVYSIELAHLLFAAASEVDTVAKCVCKILDPKAECENINDYRKVITKAEGEETYPPIMVTTGDGPKLKPEHRHKLSELQVFIPHYSISVVPWESWEEDKNPDWWHSYNHVKHQRNTSFHEATLGNAINALGGLLALNYVYCRILMTKDHPENRYQVKGRYVTSRLQPESTFMRFREDYYESLRDDMAGFVRSMVDGG